MMTFRSRVAYAVGDAGINLYFMSTLSFLLYFYTDFYGISAAVAAGIFFVARIVDAVTDPFMGYLADHTRSRWGRFRPYLAFGAIPLAVISIATFTIPDFNETGKIIWAYVTYVLFGVIYTIVTIPYAAMTSVLTDDHDERAMLTSLRMGGAFSGAMVVTLGMMPLVSFFGVENGFQYTMILYGIVGTLLLWWAFGGTKERTDLALPEQRISLPNAMNALFRNTPLWIVIALFILGMLAFTFRQTVAPFYFKYTMARPELITHFFSITLAVMFIGLIFVPFLTKRFGKAVTVQIGAIVAMIGATGFYFNDPSNIVMVFVWGCIMAVGGAPIAVLGWAMLADTIEYAQHAHDVRADGVIYSTASFFQKVGKTVAGTAIPAILALTGFVANQAQSSEVLGGILLCIAVIPFIANLALLLIPFVYKLDADAHGKIVRELKERLRIRPHEQL
ncbi:MAG: MFS transporter [Gammaproteobacteria bacterium]|nr:MFS transporter [Gammaproteobacteria bacterium]